MVSISYLFLVFMITILWILVRTAVCKKTGTFCWKRELQLMLVYICIVVVRFTFHLYGKVNGRLQPLVFDASNCFPPRINLMPIVLIFDYSDKRELLLNLIGNTAMFVPLGIVWPSVFKQLDTHGKIIAAGVGCSLLIEILQLPFYDRVTDIDDLILNSLGFLIGYGIYLRVKTIKNSHHKRKEHPQSSADVFFITAARWYGTTIPLRGPRQSGAERKCCRAGDDTADRIQPVG